MIRSLRRRHRRMTPMLFFVLVVAAALAALYSAPSPLVEAIPVEIREPWVEGNSR